MIDVLGSVAFPLLRSNPFSDGFVENSVDVACDDGDSDEIIWVAFPLAHRVNHRFFDEHFGQLRSRHRERAAHIDKRRVLDDTRSL